MRATAFFLMLFLSFAGSMAAADLDVVTVAAPAINCRFDTDCKITVSDTSDVITWKGLPPGQGFLQSRTWPQGQPGTPGAKLYAYLYRIDLTNWLGSEGPSGQIPMTSSIIPCVTELRLTFGPVVPLDYDGNGDKDQVFVITQGGLGSVKPSAVIQTGNEIVFKFLPPVCGSLKPGKGQTTFFFGLASKQPPQPVVAKVTSSVAPPFSLKARAPKLVLPLPGKK